MWCKIPLPDGEKKANAVIQACAKRINDTRLTTQDVENIQSRQMDVIPKSLSLDPIRLEKLRRLCQLWEVDIRIGEITSHRKYIGPVIVKAKQLMFPVMRFMLKDLIREQRDFNSASIQLMASLCNEAHGAKDKR